jgi:hypothetical protein
LIVIVMIVCNIWIVKTCIAGTLLQKVKFSL